MEEFGFVPMFKSKTSVRQLQINMGLVISPISYEWSVLVIIEH